MRSTFRRGMQPSVRWFLLVPLTLLMAFPLVWMIRVAMLSPNSVIDLDSVWKMAWSFENILYLLKSSLLWRPLLNSVLVGSLVTVGNILFCFMVGYSIARRRNRFNRFLLYSVLAVTILPTHIVMIPLYLMAIKSGAYNTYAALILPWLVTPIGIFLVRQYVLSLPTAMEEAARVDGASEWTILFRVVMPVCRPVLAVLAIQVFFTNWNSFLFPFILTSSDSLRTLPVALAMLQGQQNIDWPQVMAGAFLSMLPVLIVYAILQRQIIAGLTAGAVKQ